MRLGAARWHLAQERPYLAAALWALTPIERPGLGTLAVDRSWRLYWDPAVCERFTLAELAGVLYHEVGHLLREHHARLSAHAPRLANLAGDAEINDDLCEEGVTLPEGCVTPQVLGLPSGRLAEEYAAALAQRTAPEQGEGASGAAGGSLPSGGASEVAGAATGEDASAAASTAGSDGGHAPEAHGAFGGDSLATAPSDSAGSQRVDSSGFAGDSPQPTAGPASDCAGGTSGTDAPARVWPAASCGSAATGRPEAYELPEDDSSAVSEAEAKVLRRQVAEAIRTESSRGRGKVPGHWRRWADCVLTAPRQDWRRELAAALRGALADTVGASDYSWRRPTRRAASCPDVVLPALRQPVPEVAVVVDTSGSVGEDKLSSAFAELQGILRATGQRGVSVLTVDSAVHAVRRVCDARQVTAIGGGGTDMRVGVAAAAQLRPRPHVVVVLTDGETPWPSEPPHGVRVVVGLLGPRSARYPVPDWARVVEVEAP